MTRSGYGFALLPLLSLLGCSSSNPTTTTTTPDAGGSTTGDDAGTIVDAADATPPIDASEPAWSGVTVEPGCTTNGCIRAFTRAPGYSKNILATKAATGQHVDNGIQIWLIKYMSDGVELTGSVYVPDSAPPAGGLPVMVMNQFTSGVGPPCAPSQGSLGIGVASSTSLRGILTIVPDAPSYGGSKLGVYMAAPPAG